MLHFYGIHFNPQGMPERYELTIALRESLNAGLHIYEHFAGDQMKAIKAIDQEIDRLFQNSDPRRCKSKQFRFLLAKWLRTKDIVHFLHDKSQDCSIRLEIAQILNTPKKIEEKWKQIESLVTQYLLSFQPENREEMLHHPNSEIGLLMQMVCLIFMEQDDEAPPANLNLQFVRDQFPKIVWKKTDGISSVSHPFWLPRNPYCRIPFLLSRGGGFTSYRNRAVEEKSKTRFGFGRRPGQLAG